MILKVRFNLFEKLSLMFLSSLLILATSCSLSDDIPEENIDTNSPIVLTAKMKSFATITRANGPLVDGSFENGLPFSIFRADEATQGSGFSGSVKRHYAAEWVGEPNFLTFTTPQYYLKEERKTALLAVYPRVKSVTEAEVTEGANVTSSTLIFNIDGDTDIIATNWVTGKRKIEGGETTFDPFNMDFDHLLTMIKVKASLGEGVTPGIFGKVTGVEIKDVFKKADFHFPTIMEASQLPTLSGKDSKGDLGLIMPESVEITAATTENATAIGYCMMLPRGNEELNLIITTERGGEFLVTIPSNAMTDGLKRGYRYTISLEFTSSEIVFGGVSLTPWEDGQIDGVYPIN